jgi:hypothetical protein
VQGALLVVHEVHGDGDAQRAPGLGGDGGDPLGCGPVHPVEHLPQRAVQGRRGTRVAQRAGVADAARLGELVEPLVDGVGEQVGLGGGQRRPAADVGLHVGGPGPPAEGEA